MTRSDFDHLFAASQATTNGFSDAELRAINDAVFAAVQHMDVEDRATEDVVKFRFDQEHNRF
jgi:hypothetical protein